MNPFEIRLELLKLAYQIETEKVALDRNRQEQDWFAKRDMTPQGVALDPFPTPKTITVDDVINAAETLNAFVSKSNTDSK